MLARATVVANQAALWTFVLSYLPVAWWLSRWGDWPSALILAIAPCLLLAPCGGLLGAVLGAATGAVRPAEEPKPGPHQPVTAAANRGARITFLGAFLPVAGWLIHRGCEPTLALALTLAVCFLLATLGGLLGAVVGLAAKQR